MGLELGKLFSHSSKRARIIRSWYSQERKPGWGLKRTKGGGNGESHLA
jgi:hypothetical protein